MNEVQINNFIEKHHVKRKIEKAFKKILKVNSEEDLDIKAKNIFIDPLQINYKKTDFNYHLFSTFIKDKHKTIGLFALVFSDDAEIRDEFFIID